MKKAELKAIADRYEMEIVRHPVTDEFTCLFLKTENLIPELDEVVERTVFDNVKGIRELGFDGFYRYRIYPPNNWFDLWGWR